MGSASDRYRLATLPRGLPDPYSLHTPEDFRRALSAVYECLGMPPAAAAEARETEVEGRNGIRAQRLAPFRWLVETDPGTRQPARAAPASAAAASSDPGYPWGDRWLWGFEFSGGNLLVHNPYVKARTEMVRLSSGASFSVAAQAGEWGVRVDLDWALGPGARYGAACAACTAAELLAGPDSSADGADRIPVALFDGETLVLDYLHGPLFPQLWTF